MKHALATVSVLQPSPLNDLTSAAFLSLDCTCGFTSDADTAAEAWPAFIEHILEELAVS